MATLGRDQHDAGARIESTYANSFNRGGSLLPNEDATRLDRAPLVDGEPARDHGKDAQGHRVEDDIAVCC